MILNRLVKKLIGWPFSNNRLKGMNNWLENRVKTLEKEMNNSKTHFENLEMIYKNSSCNCDSSHHTTLACFPRLIHLYIGGLPSVF